MAPVFEPSKAFRDYLHRPIPDANDEVVEAVLVQVARGTREDREALRAKSSIEDAQVFNAFAQRMAVRAVREASMERLEMGLLGLSMAGALDYRENLMVLSLLARSAQKLGSQLTSILDFCDDRLPAQALSRFRDFESWSESDKDIRLMGFAETGTGNSFNYVRASPWS